MPGKPFQSKLKPYETELRGLLASGGGFRAAAQEINRRHGLNVSHNAVFSFLKNRPAQRSERGLFYEGLPADLSDQLLKRLAAEWTHESTAIEGNTLTLKRNRQNSGTRPNHRRQAAPGSSGGLRAREGDPLDLRHRKHRLSHPHKG